MGRWLSSVDGEGVDGLLRLNEVLVRRVIRGSGLRRLTLDVDGSVVSTGLKVAQAMRKNFQLDLFDPDDGHYEYSAVATNKSISGRTLWYFMCGRGAHEKVYGELKGGFAFDSVPTQRFEANSAWQVLSIIAFNLMRGFQAKKTAQQCRSRNRKRRTLRRFELIHTLRYRFLNRAGLIVHPSGKATLDVGNNTLVRERFNSIHQGLTAA